MTALVIPSFATEYTKVDTPSLSFKDNNALKIWSACKAMGMTDNQAAAVIGVFEEESHLDPAALEGVYETGLTETKQKILKNRKSLADYTKNKLFPMYAKNGLRIDKGAYKGTDGQYYPAVVLAQFT